MQLVSIRENEIHVALDWADVKYLTHIIRDAISHDVGSTAHDETMYLSYAETAEAFLLAAGMASWAQTVDEQTFSLERFLGVVQLTPEDERRWRERVAAAQQKAAEERPPSRGRAPAAD